MTRINRRTSARLPRDSRRTVIRPTVLPPCSKASGIIESASMVSTAPAAKPSAYSPLWGTLSATTYPIAAVIAVATNSAVHMLKTLRLLWPAAFRAVVPAIPCGMFETKIAVTKRHADPAALPSSVMPRMNASGTPSRRAPMNIAAPEPCLLGGVDVLAVAAAPLVDEPVADVVRDSPEQHRRRTCRGRSRDWRQGSVRTPRR